MDVAKDALPGQYNTLWFNATQLGTFVNDIRCKELCGIGHARMTGNFTVVTQAAYNSWYASLKTPPTTTSTASATGPTKTVTIPSGVGAREDGLNFSPASISVASGTTVTWVNDDTTSIHNVYFLTMPTGATIPTNPSPDTNTWTNNMFSVTLTVPGTYTYECQYHNGWMQGTITVTG
jgi:plastocyanin